MPSHSGLFTVIERAARKAGPRLRRDFGEVQKLQVSRKGVADFVSMADQRDTTRDGYEPLASYGVRLSHVGLVALPRL